MKKFSLLMALSFSLSFIIKSDFDTFNKALNKQIPKLKCFVN